MPKKLSETKREREKVIQAWLDLSNPDELRVYNAFLKLREKHNMTTKQVIAQSILFAAEQGGIDTQKPYSMIVISEMFKNILEKIDGMVLSGNMPKSQASELVSVLGGSGIQYEDLDTTARSLASNYVGFQLEDDED